jgi:hypothetical protein
MKENPMRGRVFGLMVALGLVLGSGSAESAELYLWTDERGVVHMTDQWANVPESARSQVSVRESSAVPRDGTLATDHATRTIEPLTLKQPPLQMPPEMAQTPPQPLPAPPVVLSPRESSVLIPSDRPFVHHPNKPSPPFPYNVRLDPFDSNFVWVGSSRVPKDTFTYPRISLDKQVQFQTRIRMLEQRQSAPHKLFPGHPGRR